MAFTAGASGAVTSLIVGAALLLIAGGPQQVDSTEAPPTPIFADNYHVHGLLSLPYAELNEPFNAYYDKHRERSRTDYYGGEYKVYQFGPKGGAAKASQAQYGIIYKLVYVPANFHTPTEAGPASGGDDAMVGKLERAFEKTLLMGSWQRLDQDTSQPSRSAVRRACFGVPGGVGFTVQPQTVLPKLDHFVYDSTGRCPHLAGHEHRGARCELWKSSTQVGEKKNTYKFWVRRDGSNSSLAIPVHYYMLGYDSLLGSHYDRYDISYFQYKAGGARDTDFELEQGETKCGPMPGPGFSPSSSASASSVESADSMSARMRAHLVVQNPIHEFVSEPHRYDHIDHHYEQFLAKFDKPPSQANDRTGWFNFLHNFRFIHGKNRELKEYKLEVNKFADENIRELRYLRGRLHSRGYNGGLDYAQHHPKLRTAGGPGGDQPLPDFFDWTALGGVTPVKDQAVCGSCWSFGTAGTMEGAYFAKTGRLLRLSQQQLVDCSWQFGNNGCDGGEDFRAYKYIMQAGGLSTEEDYGHYKGIDGRCHDEDVERPVKISGFYNVTANSVDALKHAIVTYGPVSISIDASRPTFTFYSHGAYYDDKCQNSPDNLDHSVLAVGYMRINGKLVWKVKNSWSTYWGNDGYIYMLAENNNCGVLDAPTVPIIKLN